MQETGKGRSDMLTLCWFYCIPLAKFVYYLLGPFFIAFAMFALKRGIRRHRPGLRQAAFFMVFGAIVKMFLFDVRTLAGDIKGKLCGRGGLPGFDCVIADVASGREKTILSVVALLILVAASVVLFHFYRLYMPDRKVKEVTPEQINFRAWVNGTFWMIILMGFWTAAPWVASLVSESGTPPRIFQFINWQMLAVLNIGLLLVDFWKMESCVWETKITDSAQDKARRKHLQNSWTPRDTLWMAVFLYILTLGLSYITWDVLKPQRLSDPVKSQPGFFKGLIPNVDTSNPNLNP
jgi:hypothetical protein